MKFKIEAIKREFKEEVVEANNVQDALTIFNNKYPDFKLDGVSEGYESGQPEDAEDIDYWHDVIGRCEGCGRWLFDNSEYAYCDGFNDMLCRNCAPADAELWNADND